MEIVVQPNAWVVLRLPSGALKNLQVVPHTTISLGKYGSFPSNLILDRPYHLTYEIQDKAAGEAYCRLRVVAAQELYEDVRADEAVTPGSGTPALLAPEDDGEASEQPANGVEYSLVDTETNTVVAESIREPAQDGLRQTLTQDEIEALKREGASAGKDLIAKLLLSHTALDQKTAFSLAKYKLFKERKFLRRFTVLPLDVANLTTWQIEYRDATKILEIRHEMMGLLGCLANVRYAGGSVFFPSSQTHEEPHGHVPEPGPVESAEDDNTLFRGRWLVVDDTGGLVVAALAERMGILRSTEDSWPPTDTTIANGAIPSQNVNPSLQESGPIGPGIESMDGLDGTQANKQAYNDDFYVPISRNNTITLISSTTQPSVALLKYFGYDVTLPNPPAHPLATHLLNLTWLQLLNPEADLTYSIPPPSEPESVLASWKPARRGNYHRKRRRWARAHYTVRDTRAGNFAGLVVAATMDPVSVLRHLLPLLAGGAPIAVYSPALEPLTQLADCFSVARRAAWNGASRPAAAAGLSADELARWPGSDEFPLNPALVLGAAVHTSRVRQWQVLPGRTHPVMNARGGADGYIFTGWRARPAEGRVQARGKYVRPRRARGGDEESADAAGDMDID